MLTFINYWIVVIFCLVLFLGGIVVLYGKSLNSFRGKHTKECIDLGVCLWALGFVICLVMTLQKFI